MKKIAIVFGVLIGLLVIAAIAVPMFVDVDKYRPQIMSAADQRLNGKLELGKLSLSLWGQVKIQIDGLQLTDAHGNKVVSVKDAYFNLPFSSILSGSPSLTLNLYQPALMVVKDKSGKLNVMTLMKQNPSEALQGGAGQPQANQPAGETKLPGIVAHSRLGMEITKAFLTYKDETLGSETKVSDLNIMAKNLSLSHEMSLEVIANLNSETKAADQKGGATVIQGPIRLTATADPKVSGGKFESVSMKAKMSLDDLDIRVGDVFHKAKGVDAHADIDLTASPEAAEIKSAMIKFFNAEIQGKGSVSNLSAKDASGKPASVVNFSMKSNTIELKPWNQLVPMLTEYELGGSADLSAEANGPADKLGYKALLKVNSLTAKAPNLKEQPKFDGTISVVTDQIDNLLLTMSAPGNDLKIQGKVVNFQAPKADIQVTSTGMDLDRLINFPPPAEKQASGKPATGATTAEKGQPKSDLDASLEPLRTNKALQNMVANIGVNIHTIKAKGMVMSDIMSKMSMRDLVASVDSASMKLFGGGMKASFSTNLRPKTPTYKFDASVSKLDIAQAVASQFQAFKNTLTGTASLDMSGTGASFNTDPAMANLNSKGKFKVENAVFTTLDVGKMVTDGLNSAIGKISEKIPGMKGKSIGGGAKGGESKYDYVSSDFTIREGQFSAPNFVAKAAPNKGIDLKGNVAVGLKEQSLKANFEIIDTYNLTHAKDISVNQGGVEVNHVLAEGNGPVRFPVSVGCTLMAPCYSYTQVPEFLIKVALNNALGGVKSQVQNKAKDILKGMIPQGSGGGSNPLGDFGKKLFGH